MRHVLHAVFLVPLVCLSGCSGSHRSAIDGTGNGEVVFGLRGDPTPAHAEFQRLAKERFGVKTTFVGHHLSKDRSREVNEQNRLAIDKLTAKHGREAFEQLLKDSNISRRQLIVE